MPTTSSPFPRPLSIPKVIVTPPTPSPSDPGPTGLLARARRHGHRPYVTPSPELLSPSWTPRPAYATYEDEHDFGYDTDEDNDYIPRPKSPSRRRFASNPTSQPEPQLSLGAVFAAVFLPLLNWRSGRLDLPMPAHSPKRTRRSPSSIIFVLLLLGTTFALSAALHASTMATELEYGPTSSTDRVGLFFPARGLQRQHLQQQQQLNPAPRAQGPRPAENMHSQQMERVAVWDLL